MPDTTVFMFPGQGSQYAGMRSFLGNFSDRQNKLFELADELLGHSICNLIDNGPDSKLTRTSNAQPALLVVGLAAAYGLEDQGYRADIVLGHSLGEYTALVYCGCLSIEDGLGLVRLRGKLMEEASEACPGSMAAVIGADRKTLKAYLEDRQSNGVLEITNVNAPNQLVLSGEKPDIEQAINDIKKENIGRAVRLNVSAPFHCSLMKPIAARFAKALESVEICKADRPFIDNVTASVESDPDEIRNKLLRQLYSPVLWEASVKCAGDLGADRFIEAGPGATLCGLVKRTLRKTPTLPAEKLLSD